MGTPPKRIIERIRKLLATAGDERNQSKDERDSALEIAKKLAKKWNIKLEEVKPEHDNADDLKGPRSSSRGVGARMRFHERLACQLVSEIYKVTSLGADRPGGRCLYTFVGEDHDRARLKFEAVVSGMEDSWDAHVKMRICGQERLVKGKHSFMSGYYHGLKDKLNRELVRANNTRTPWRQLAPPEKRKLKMPEPKALPPGPPPVPWVPPPHNPFALAIIPPMVVIKVEEGITERRMESEDEKQKQEDKDPAPGSECELDFYQYGVTSGVKSPIKYD